jgi:hypothetical protein
MVLVHPSSVVHWKMVRKAHMMLLKLLRATGGRAAISHALSMVRKAHMMVLKLLRVAGRTERGG